MAEQQKLTAWDYVLLACIVLAPAFGSLTVAIALLAGLAALALLLIRRGAKPTTAQKYVAGVMFAYFGYFFVAEWIRFDLEAAVTTMAANLPLVSAGILALTISESRSNMTSKVLAKWAAMAALLTILVAVLIYAVQPDYSVNGSTILWLTGVNKRLEMLAGNSAVFAALLLCVTWLSVVGFSTQNRTSRLLIITVLCLGIAVVSFWAKSRNAMLLAIILIGWSLWLFRPNIKQVALSMIALVALLAALATIEPIAERGKVFANHTLSAAKTVLGLGDDPDVSTSTRLVLYGAAVAAIKQAPLVGYGKSAFMNKAEEFAPEGVNFKFTHLHNTFLTHWASAGLPGIFLILLFILTPVATEMILKPKSRDVRYLTGLIVIVTAGTGMTSLLLNHDLQSNFFAILMVVHLVIALNAKAHRTE